MLIALIIVSAVLYVVVGCVLQAHITCSSCSTWQERLFLAAIWPAFIAVFVIEFFVMLAEDGWKQAKKLRQKRKDVAKGAES